MIEHKLQNQHGVIVEVDFVKRMMLVGETHTQWDAQGRSKRTWIDRYHRIRWTADGTVRDELIERKASQQPPLDEPYTWRKKRELDRVKVTSTRVCVQVDRKDLLRAVERIVSLSGGSLGVDGLLALRLTSSGIVGVSLGETVTRVTVEHHGDKPADTGLGEVVILAPLLRDLLRDASSERVTLVIDRSARLLRVQDSALWTVAWPQSIDFEPSTAGLRSYPILGALRRAFAFTCKDDSRTTIACVRLVPTEHTLTIETTDGHRMWRQVVIEDDFAPLMFNGHDLRIPSAVMRQIVKVSKRSSHVALGRSGVIGIVRVDDTTFELRPTHSTFPPSDQIIGRGLAGPSGHTWAPLSLATAEALLKWLREWGGDSDEAYVDLNFGPNAIKAVTSDTRTASFGDADKLSGLPLTYRLRLDYFTEMLATFVDARLDMEIGIAATLDPVVLRNATSVGVTMPLRT